MAKKPGLRQLNQQQFQQEVARELGIDLNAADQVLQHDNPRQERLQDAAGSEDTVEE